MEYRDETPRRRERRTKRRNETRGRDITRSETNRSAAGRRRIRRDDDDDKLENDAAVEDVSSDEESDDEDEVEPTSGSPSTIASPTAPPPGTATLSPTPPPPPPAVNTPPSTTLDTQTVTSQPITNTPIGAGETTDPPRDQNGDSLSRQSTSPVVPPAATTAIAVIGSLAGIGLLAFLFWKLYRRRRGRDEPDQDSGKEFYGGPKSDIRIMDEAMAAAYKAEGGYAPSTHHSEFIPPHNDPSRARDESADQVASRWSDSTPGWLRRQVQKVKPAPKPAEEDESSPKDAAVSRWMDRHASRMLDPMAARASIASSGAASLRGLGPVPSVSPASVVGDPRESILSEMGQIRRAAVPPPLDPRMVERVRQMREEGQARGQEQQQARDPAGGEAEGDMLRPPPPMADRWGGSSPTAMSPARTETTWNTWGVEQRRK